MDSWKKGDYSVKSRDSKLSEISEDIISPFVNLILKSMIP